MVSEEVHGLTANYNYVSSNVGILLLIWETVRATRPSKPVVLSPK